MELTIEELKEKLEKFDEVLLLEILEVNSTDLVNLCDELIELNYDKLMRIIE